jgi:hypothetical protein
MIFQLISRSIQISAVAVVAVLVQTTTSLPAGAIALVTQRDELQANDTIDWGNLGFGTPIDLIPGTIFNSLPNSFQTTSENGLDLGVDIPMASNPRITPPFVFQVSPNLPVNFGNGDFILFTGLDPTEFPAPGNPGPITITFNTPVQGAGAQIAVDDTLAFTVFVSAFDDNNNLLGNFSIPGTAATVIDNSAAFLGVSSDSANISKLVFSSSEPNRALGINSLSISSVAVPESMNPLAFGLLGLGLLAFKKKEA